MRISRRRISIRDSNSPSAGAAHGARSTARSTTARNPSPQSRREVLQAASAASSQAYSRSSSMIQLARYTAGWKKKTACTTRWATTTQRSPRRTWASSWSRTQVNCLGVRPSHRSGGITTDGRSSPPTAGEWSRGRPPSARAAQTPTAVAGPRRRSAPTPGGAARRRDQQPVGRERHPEEAEQQQCGAQSPGEHQHRRGRGRCRGRRDGRWPGRRRRGPVADSAAPTAAGSAITTAGGSVDAPPGSPRDRPSSAAPSTPTRLGRRSRAGRRVSTPSSAAATGVRRPPGPAQAAPGRSASAGPGRTGRARDCADTRRRNGSHTASDHGQEHRTCRSGPAP